MEVKLAANNMQLSNAMTAAVDHPGLLNADGSTNVGGGMPTAAHLSCAYALLKAKEPATEEQCVKMHSAAKSILAAPSSDMLEVSALLHLVCLLMALSIS